MVRLWFRARRSATSRARTRFGIKSREQDSNQRLALERSGPAVSPFVERAEIHSKYNVDVNAAA